MSPPEGQELPDVKTPPPGMRSRALVERLSELESPAFDARRRAREATSGEDESGIVYARGRGANVWDVDGNRYVDLTAGFGALVLGHPPNVASAAARAAEEDLLLALGDVYASELKVRAMQAVARVLPEPGARAMFGLSGADAVTCALKTALLSTKKAGVVAFAGSYHGLSHGPLAALGFAPSFREPFAAHLGVPVTFAPYPSTIEELEPAIAVVRAATKNGDVGAILVEPVLGRGGCVVPPASFLAALRSLADDCGALLVFDEIWTGMGRTGALFAFERIGVVPDLLCLGKGLGGGYPISACVGRARVMEAWAEHGGATLHTGTHFGAPAPCAALLATLEAVRGLGSRVADTGERFVDDLRGRGVRARGVGLMIGIELDDAASALAVSRGLLGRGYIVLTGGVAGNVITLAPPLTIDGSLLEAFAIAIESELASRR